MAFGISVKRWILTFVLLYVCVFGKNFGTPLTRLDETSFYLISTFFFFCVFHVLSHNLIGYADDDDEGGSEGENGGEIGGGFGGPGGGIGTGGGGIGGAGGGGFGGAGGGIGGGGAGVGGGGGFGAGGGGVGGDPSQIFAKALLCFNDKYVSA